MYLSRIAITCLIVAIAQTVSHAEAEPETYADVKSFIRVMPGAKVEESGGTYGELSQTGRKDWAGIIYSDDSEQGRMRQIFVLTQEVTGRYMVAAKGDRVSADGGTGHHFIENLEIRKRSIFISSSWNWHGCRGGADHQFKLYKDDWQLVGVTFSRSNAMTTSDGSIDTLDSVKIDRNVLTGNTLIHFKPAHKKTVEIRKTIKPELLMIKDYEDSLGWSDEFNGYADC